MPLTKKVAVLLSITFFAIAANLSAQQTCASVLQAKGEDAAGDESCFVLAVIVVDHLTEKQYIGSNADAQIPPRDIQQTNSGNAATGGSVAQSEAVPTVQPMAIGGGSIAAVGSDAGADAITALTFNPAIFFADPDDTEATAKWSRLSDVTLFFPVDGLDADEDGDIDYFGVRLRINMTGVGAGSRIMREARDEFRRLVSMEDASAVRLETGFLRLEVRSPDALPQCVDTLLSESPEAAEVTESCGSDLLVVLEGEEYEEFRNQLADIRRKADARYFGLDIRLDFGDPTLGAVPNASGTSITGGLAFGREFIASSAHGASSGLKGRFGIRFTDLEEVDKTSFALDGGLAFEARRPLETGGTVVLSSGFEFRFADEDSMRSELQTDFLIFRASLLVPITGSTGISIAVGAPLIGESVSPTLTISANWGLLLSALPRP